mmetsp:Transcript_94957/g.274596  ORF Transcript_94957/g.274596 Transcript_94957/m.274596 type:complete len:367 (+) Transcript_94957:544-1644(+)
MFLRHAIRDVPGAELRQPGDELHHVMKARDDAPDGANDLAEDIPQARGPQEILAVVLVVVTLLRRPLAVSSAEVRWEQGRRLGSDGKRVLAQQATDNVHANRIHPLPTVLEQGDSHFAKKLAGGRRGRRLPLPPEPGVLIWRCRRLERRDLLRLKGSLVLPQTLPELHDVAAHEAEVPAVLVLDKHQRLHVIEPALEHHLRVPLQASLAQEGNDRMRARGLAAAAHDLGVSARSPQVAALDRREAQLPNAGVLGALGVAEDAPRERRRLPAKARALRGPRGGGAGVATVCSAQGRLRAHGPVARLCSSWTRTHLARHRRWPGVHGAGGSNPHGSGPRAPRDQGRPTAGAALHLRGLVATVGGRGWR